MTLETTPSSEIEEGEGYVWEVRARTVISDEMI